MTDALGPTGGLAWRCLVGGFHGGPRSHDDRIRWSAFGASAGRNR